MKKVSILLIACMMVSVSFSCGCNEQADIKQEDGLEPIILDHTSYNGYIEVFGTGLGGLEIYGIIKNVASVTIEDVEILVALRDASSNIIDFVLIAPKSSQIESNGKSLFETTFLGDVGYYDHYTAEIISFEESQNSIYKDLKLENVWVDRSQVYPDSEGHEDWYHHTIYGDITNTGSKIAISVKVTAIFYDENDKLIAWGRGFPEDNILDVIGTIYSGQRVSFEIFPNIKFSDFSNISSYELEVGYLMVNYSK